MTDKELLTLIASIVIVHFVVGIALLVYRIFFSKKK
jgi:hypothetical protein